jgi:hypothetical protein
MDDELAAKLFSGIGALLLRNKLELAMECMRGYSVIPNRWESWNLTGLDAAVGSLEEAEGSDWAISAC